MLDSPQPIDEAALCLQLLASLLPGTLAQTPNSCSSRARVVLGAAENLRSRCREIQAKEKQTLKTCSALPSSGPGHLQLLEASVGTGGFRGGGSQVPSPQILPPWRLAEPSRSRAGGDCMKLFTSDSAVYKREAGWVGRGGISQASGGLGNALSAPACAVVGPPGQLQAMGRREQRWL